MKKILKYFMKKITSMNFIYWFRFFTFTLFSIMRITCLLFPSKTKTWFKSVQKKCILIHINYTIMSCPSFWLTPDSSRLYSPEQLLSGEPRLSKYSSVHLSLCCFYALSAGQHWPILALVVTKQTDQHKVLEGRDREFWLKSI